MGSRNQLRSAFGSSDLRYLRGTVVRCRLYRFLDVTEGSLKWQGMECHPPRGSTYSSLSSPVRLSIFSLSLRCDVLETLRSKRS